MKYLAIMLMVIGLSGCETMGAVFGSSDFFQEASNKGAAIADTALDKAATGFELYCAQIPGDARTIVRARFNEKTVAYNIPDICVPKPVSPE